MNDIRNVVKKRFMFFVMSISLFCYVFIKIFNDKFLPVIVRFGEYQCESISTRIINYVLSNQLSKDIEDKIILLEDNESPSIEINLAILNSIASNVILNLQNYYYLLEKGELNRDVANQLNINVDEYNLKKGIVYEIPMGYALNNALINNMGFKIPVRYKLIGDLKGKLVSSVTEYGINNALLEIGLEITSKVSVSIPMLTEEKINVVSVPIVIKVIQGEIPNIFLGEKVIGEVGQ